MTFYSAARALQVYRRLPERPHRLVISTPLTTMSAAPTLPTTFKSYGLGRSQEVAMHSDVGPGGSASGARSVGRIFNRLANSRGALVAGASLLAAFALSSPSQALAACGTTIP